MVGVIEAESILDIGCGRKPYEHLFQGKTYKGIDVAESGHNHLSSSVDKYYDGVNIPYPDNSFDLVFSTQVFEHAESLDDLMAEARRVLRPRGYIIVTMPFVWPEHEMPYDFRRFTSVGIKQWLTSHGVEVLHCNKVGNAFLCFGSLLNNQLFISIPVTNKYLKLLIWAPIGIVINTVFALLSLIFGDRDPLLYTDIAVVGRMKDD